MERSDLIALLAVCFTALAALYARWAAIQARKTNKITIQTELKPRRLSVYASVKDFLHFCSTYETMQSLKMVRGTRDLVSRINTFKWEAEQHGPLDMPKVEDLIKNARTKAWQLQRLLDRLAGLNAKPIEKGFKSAQDNVDAIIEWFAKQEKELKKIFEPYLKITKQ
jgi:hypothetical protein